MADGYLVFRGPSRGQGVGSTMRGVAAALALGARHNRHVCVHWRTFELAFEQAAPSCPRADDYFVMRTEGTAVLDPALAFELWTSDGDADAHHTRAAALLASNRSVVVMEGDGAAGAARSRRRGNSVVGVSG